MSKILFFCFSLFAIGFSQAQTQERWLSADPGTVECYMFNRATWSILVSKKTVYSVDGFPLVSDSQVRPYQNCNAAVSQARFDRKTVYINLDTGDAKPEDGFFIRQQQ